MRKVALITFAGMTLAAAAPDPAERLPDPKQEARARELFRQIRCVVCQNESIDDSEADLAADLRGLIREQVARGRSDAEVRAFLVARYGEFVLLKPSFSPGNLILWLTPAVVIGVAGVALFVQSRRRRAPEGPLTPDEESQLTRLQDDAGGVPPNRRQKNTFSGDAKVT